MQDALNTGARIAAPGKLHQGLFGALHGSGRKPGAVCTICGHHGEAHRHVSGSDGLEVALWALFLVPGLLYRLWRIASTRRVCARCGAEHLVAPDSPIGRRLLCVYTQD